MARRARLIAAIALAVLLMHGAVLELLWQRMQQASQPRVLRPMATPLLTRLLRPAPPAASTAATPPRREKAPRSSGVAALRARPSTPGATTSTTPTASRATAPDQEPVVVAQAPAPDAPLPAPPEPVAPSATFPASFPASFSASSADSSAAPPPAAAASAPPAADTALDSWPADTRLSYRLSGWFRGDLHGDARVQWQRRAGQYEVRVEIDIGPLARVAMTSQGLVTPQGLQPRAYEEQVSGKTRGVLLGHGAITFADGRAVPRPEGVQDTASQFVELAHRFASGQSALEVGQSVQFWMSRPGAVDLWTYDIVKTETLHTPRLGAVQAWHLKPRPLAHPRGNITAEMWFAPSLRHLPVRIRISLGESVFVDLLVDKIEQR